ncbi:malate dehydrogenase [Blattabacterium cuenoti]|uniref:malate dehydrogenase n=1 Tax=Blattabacterium cuenoti TaxID=1653831 RepID=UPI00163BB211|nr:malate dehydrogenase [Blattabacterium cuenoti]
MKVTIIGAGNVGSSCASLLSHKDIVTEIVLLDIKPMISKGKSLDISQMNVVCDINTRLIGFGNDFSKSENSEIIVITCGIPRKQGMDRDELLNINAEIIHFVTKKSIFFSPKAKFIIVSNPLDIMTYVSYVTSNIDSSSVIGMAGILDSARYRFFLSEKLNISPYNIHTVLLGGHGDYMVPLYRYTSISGIPIKEFISEKENEIIIEKTRKGGEEIVNYLGTSAWMAPAASIVEMIESILKNSKKVFSCSTLLKGEYGIKNIYLGMPVVLGKNGIERVIELNLNNEEIDLLKMSYNSVKNTIKKLKIKI